MIRDMEGKVLDRIPVENVLVSVFDKSGLDVFVPELARLSPGVRFMSTGGTYKVIDKIITGRGINASLIEVSEYTDFPEMDGGLVKTLHPKIHAGILGERGNLKHQAYLDQLGGGVYIDGVVVNLYPFEDIIEGIKSGKIDPKTSRPYNFETARGNIDIGGPAMIRAAGKNFPGCAVVCRPEDYQRVLTVMRCNEGSTRFNQRMDLAGKVFKMTGKYDTLIGAYLEEQAREHRDEVRALYDFAGDGDGVGEGDGD